MSKIIVQSKHGVTTITNRLTYPESVNERVNNAIAFGVFDGFLPVEIKQKRKETYIECNVQGLISAEQYFKDIISKYAFLDFAYRLTQIIKSCDKNMISANNLDLQTDRIFMDLTDRSIKCIYWPVVNNQCSEPPQTFLKKLPSLVMIDKNEDVSYMETYTKFFEGFNSFSINSFERLLLTLQGKDSASSRSSSGIPSEGNAKRKKDDTIPTSSDVIEYDPVSEAMKTQSPYSELDRENSGGSVVCSSCGAVCEAAANFCSVCGNKLNRPEGGARTGKPGSASAGSEPNGLGEYGSEGPGNYKRSYPLITRIKTGEAFYVDKPAFRIGTDREKCDLFVNDNSFISRNHAEILTRAGRYYIADNHSTNGTFIDGSMIPRESMAELNDGSVIQLANEVFVFTLE